jgi:Protein of unknown function (DUF3618)
VGEDPGALRRDVADARVRLGDTVDALVFKASAPRRAAGRAAAVARAGSRPAAMAAAVAVAAVVAARVRGRR